jgi:hypothetical protein
MESAEVQFLFEDCFESEALTEALKNSTFQVRDISLRFANALLDFLIAFGDNEVYTRATKMYLKFKMLSLK